MTVVRVLTFSWCNEYFTTLNVDIRINYIRSTSSYPQITHEITFPKYCASNVWRDRKIILQYMYVCMYASTGRREIEGMRTLTD